MKVKNIREYLEHSIKNSLFAINLGLYMIRMGLKKQGYDENTALAMELIEEGYNDMKACFTHVPVEYEDYLTAEKKLQDGYIQLYSIKGQDNSYKFTDSLNGIRDAIKEIEETRKRVFEGGVA